MWVYPRVSNCDAKVQLQQRLENRFKTMPRQAAPGRSMHMKSCISMGYPSFINQAFLDAVLTLAFLSKYDSGVILYGESMAQDVFFWICRQETMFFWCFRCLFAKILWDLHFIYGMSSFPLTLIFFKMVIAPPTRFMLFSLFSFFLS